MRGEIAEIVQIAIPPAASLRRGPPRFLQHSRLDSASNGLFPLPQNEAMFRLTLERKLFIALALLLLLLLSMFIGFSRVALQRWIGPYVAEIELSRLDWMVGNLQRAYAREGNWNSLRNNA